MTESGPIRHVEHCMGTVFSIDVRSPIGPDVVPRAVAWLHWVDAVFSTYRDDSEISQLARGELTLGECRPEVQEVLARCERLKDDTDGYFDAYASGRLDPSGFVKGWAIEHVDDQLRHAGSIRHCVNGGGDIRCAGGPDAERPWRFGIADPRAAGQLVAIVAGTDFALATSGTAERGEHVLDPHTGQPPRGLLSLSLTGAELTVVDAYATAAFAMGDAARAWVTARDGIEGLGVTTSGELWHTPGFPIAAPI